MENSKKRLITMIVSLCVAFVAVVSSVIAIFAALTQTVTSNFVVNYAAEDVSATVTANYTVSGGTKTAMKTSGGDETLVFTPTGNNDGSLSPEGTIYLEATKPVVVFEYIFKNDSNSVDVGISLITNYTTQNIDVGYAYSYSQITDYNTMPTAEAFDPMVITGAVKNDSAYDYLYVYVKAKIANIANHASFGGSISFKLERQTETPVELTFANADDSTNSLLFEKRLVPANTDIANIPGAEFGDGKKYGWYTSDALTTETLIEGALNVSENTTLFAGELPDYTVRTTTNESGETVSIVKNYTEGSVEVAASEGDTYSFGGTSYTLDANDKILVQAGQSVTVNEGTAAANASAGNVAEETTAVNVATVSGDLDLENYDYFGGYGMYPQTYVGTTLNEILLNPVNLASGEVLVTGKSYTTDIDGTETILQEYSYNGKLYAKVESTKFSGSSGSTFSDGTTVVTNGTSYFFVVEPILCEVMEKETDGTYTMMSKISLGSRKFDSDANDWQTSEIRAYLNNTFLAEAGLSEIAQETNITNTDAFGYAPTSANTTDKIWLASAEEICTWTGSSYEQFVSYWGLGDDNNAQRKSKPTDLGLATYSYYYKANDAGCYFLRSSGDSYSCVCNVFDDGGVGTGSGRGDTDYGFRPAFVINL